MLDQSIRQSIRALEPTRSKYIKNMLNVNKNNFVKIQKPTNNNEKKKETQNASVYT